MTTNAPDPTPVNRALRHVHRAVMATLAVSALVIAVDSRLQPAAPPPQEASGPSLVALALAAVAIFARRSLRPGRPGRAFVYATLASFVCVAGLGLLGVYVALARDQTTPGLLYTLAGALLGLRPPPRLLAPPPESPPPGPDAGSG